MTKPSDKKKNEVLVSFLNENQIVDTTLKDSCTQFTIFDRKTNRISEEKTLKIWEKEYVPIDSDSWFIRSGAILFPSEPMEYESVGNLISDIDWFIYKYVDVPDGYRTICTYYVLLSYLYEDFNEIPYLRVIGDYGSGKSRLLKTLWSIAHNQMMTTGGNTVASIFRMIEIFKWTLIFDEADLSQSGTQSDMIKILNNGYQKWMPIMRADWEANDLNCYEVYCPKIIWWRMEFQDKAMESRCLSNIMKRSKRKDIPKSITKEFNTEALILRNKLLMYRFDTLWKVELDNNHIDGIEPRLNQIINPLLSIISNSEHKQIILDHLKEKQSLIKDQRRESYLWVILDIIHRYMWNWYLEVPYSKILEEFEIIEWRTNMTARKIWSLLTQNSLKGHRKNSWTVLEFHTNHNELERLFKEYGITIYEKRVQSQESTNDPNVPY